MAILLQLGKVMARVSSASVLQPPTGKGDAAAKPHDDDDDVAGCVSYLLDRVAPLLPGLSVPLMTNVVEAATQLLSLEGPSAPAAPRSWVKVRLAEGAGRRG